MTISSYLKKKNARKNCLSKWRAITHNKGWVPILLHHHQRTNQERRYSGGASQSEAAERVGTTSVLELPAHEVNC